MIIIIPLDICSTLFLSGNEFSRGIMCTRFVTLQKTLKVLSCLANKYKIMLPSHLMHRMTAKLLWMDVTGQ